MTDGGDYIDAKRVVKMTVTVLREMHSYKIKNKRVCLHFSDESSELADDFSQGPGVLLPVDAQVVGQTCQKDGHKWGISFHVSRASAFLKQLAANRLH